MIDIHFDERWLTSALIQHAGKFATQVHDGQVRKYSGEPYIVHPMRVARLVAVHSLATETLVAVALLHDVIEDCGVTVEELTWRFGDSVASGVLAMTNPSKQHPELNRAERKQLDRGHAATLSPEYKVLKLFDRLDNLWDVPWGAPFTKIYVPESRLLVAVLQDADPALAGEVLEVCDRHEREWQSPAVTGE